MFFSSSTSCLFLFHFSSICSSEDESENDLLVRLLPKSIDELQQENVRVEQELEKLRAEILRSENNLKIYENVIDFLFLCTKKCRTNFYLRNVFFPRRKTQSWPNNPPNSPNCTNRFRSTWFRCLTVSKFRTCRGNFASIILILTLINSQDDTTNFEHWKRKSRDVNNLFPFWKRPFKTTQHLR